jgi:hypothetical protein
MPKKQLLIHFILHLQVLNIFPALLVTIGIDKGKLDLYNSFTKDKIKFND